MVTQISLGGFTTNSSGQTVANDIGGIGVDTVALVNQLSTAYGQQATNDQTQITANGKVTSALNQFQSLLSAFQSATLALSNPPGVDNQADNAFDFTTASVTASNGNPGSDYVNVISSPGAAIQNYTINSITNLATAATQSTGVLSAASADAAFAATGAAIQPGTITPQQTLAITNFTTGAKGSDTITATVNSVANLQVGQQITIAAATGTLDGITAGEINGTQTITSIDTVNNTFTYATSGTATAGNVSGEEGGAATATNSNLPSITIAAGDSLNQIAAKFNAVANQTGIGATVIQLASGKYELSFTATNTGSDGNFDLNSTAFDSGNTVFGGNLSAAVDGANAQFYLDGIPTAITRQSNSIDDVISGLTFNLVGTYNISQSPDSSISVNIQPDTTTIQNSIVNFVNTYNALQTFATQQTQLNSSGTYNSSAVLATNTTFRQTMADINQQITEQVAGLSGSITSLADVGITFTNQPATSTTPQVSNILTVNDGDLSSALAANFQQVENLFGSNMVSNNPDLAVFSETNALNATSFTLNIAPETNTFTATIGSDSPINLTATALPDGGYVLAGPSGSALDGLQLIYASNNDATIDVSSITQGVASVLYNTSNAATTSNTGTVAVALTGIQTQNTTLNNDITQVNARVAQYKQQLTQEYATLEALVSSKNLLLDSIAANEQAQLVQAQIG